MTEEQDPLLARPLKDDLRWFAGVYVALILTVSLPVTWFVIANGGLHL